MVVVRVEEGSGYTQPVSLQGATLEADGGEETEVRGGESSTEVAEKERTKQQEKEPAGTPK